MMRRKLPADRAVGTLKPMKKPCWQATALAIAATVVLSVPSSDAQALALGRITVQSALGEALQADIDIPDINAEEVASLRATIASPDAFRSAGLEYSSVMTSVQITLQRRPDGHYFLHLSSDRAINDPFVDLILEASWSSGRIVRDYTMLFDPQSLRQKAAPVLSAQVSPVVPQPSVSATPVPRLNSPATGAVARPAPAPRAAALAKAAASGPKVAAVKPAPSAGAKQVTVHSGDTASAIAAANKPATVSLDQMLVAMLRANPEAFGAGNVNRLKAGAVLEVPAAAEASAIPASEATQTVVAQSRDFNEFRRKLAEGVPASRIDAAQRQASGKVQALVEDKKPAGPTPDKLTLSKGSVQARASEEKIARDRAAKESSTRMAELSKNIAELDQLGTATGTPGSPGRAAGAASDARAGAAVPLGAAAVAARPAPAPAIAPKAAAAPAPTPAPTPADHGVVTRAPRLPGGSELLAQPRTSASAPVLTS